MTVELEVRNLDPIARLAIVEIVDELAGIAEEHEIEAVFVPNAGDIADQVGLVLALRAPHIAGLVDKPCDARGRAMLLAELFNADASRPNEISPPSIVRSSFELLPFDERRPAAQDDVFALRFLGRGACESQKQEEKRGVKISHAPENPCGRHFLQEDFSQIQGLSCILATMALDPSVFEKLGVFYLGRSYDIARKGVQRRSVAL